MIHLELTPEETVLLDTLLSEALIELQDDMFWADELQDWEEFDALEVEYEFFAEISDELNLQMIADEVYV